MVTIALVHNEKKVLPMYSKYFDEIVLQQEEVASDWMILIEEGEQLPEALLVDMHQVAHTQGRLGYGTILLLQRGKGNDQELPRFVKTAGEGTGKVSSYLVSTFRKRRDKYAVTYVPVPKEIEVPKRDEPEALD